MNFIKKKFVILIVLILLLVIFYPYIKAEYFTARYGDEFEGLDQQTNMLNPARYYKVLEYSEDKAKVFYVSDAGALFSFEKGEDGSWERQTWSVIWTDMGGSADSFMWPYYR